MIYYFIHDQRVAATFSDHTHPSIFLSTLNFWYQHAKNTKVGCFITFSRDTFDLKSYNLIGQQHCFGPIYMTEKQLIDLYTDFFFGSLDDREVKDGRKPKMDSIIMVKL